MNRVFPDFRYEIGGFYRAHLTFPTEYPLLPPKMVFQTPIFHPNGKPYGLFPWIPSHISLGMKTTLQSNSQHNQANV